MTVAEPENGPDWITTEVLDRYPPQDPTSALRDDFDSCFALLKRAIETDIGSFSLQGLRVPGILQRWHKCPPGSITEMPSLEVALFQEHLYERVVVLTGNRRMMREVWRFNENTRAFREYELSVPASSRDAYEDTVRLLDALVARKKDAALGSLDSCLERRLTLIGEIGPNILRKIADATQQSS